MRVLITGGMGFVGRHLVRHLVHDGKRVFVLERASYKVDGSWPILLEDIQSQIAVTFADLRDRSATVRAVRDAAPDSVIHLASAGVTDPFLDVESALGHNVHGTLNLLRACFEGNSSPNRPQQLIVARTPGELEAMNVYAASKAAAWQFCRMYAQTQGWPIHGAMIFQAYGPGQAPHTLVQAAMKAALAGEDFSATSGEQQRDWIYINDVAEGFRAALDANLSPGVTFHLGTGWPTSVAAVVRQVYELVGGGGRPVFGNLPDRPGEVSFQVAEATRTKTLLDWRAQITLEEGLKHLLQRLRA